MRSSTIERSRWKSCAPRLGDGGEAVRRGLHQPGRHRVLQRDEHHDVPADHAAQAFHQELAEMVSTNSVNSTTRVRRFSRASSSARPRVKLVSSVR